VRSPYDVVAKVEAADSRKRRRRLNAKLDFAVILTGLLPPSGTVDTRRPERQGLVWRFRSVVSFGGSLLTVLGFAGMRSSSFSAVAIELGTLRAIGLSPSR